VEIFLNKRKRYHHV